VTLIFCKSAKRLYFLKILKRAEKAFCRWPCAEEREGHRSAHSITTGGRSSHPGKRGPFRAVPGVRDRVFRRIRSVPGPARPIPKFSTVVHREPPPTTTSGLLPPRWKAPRAVAGERPVDPKLSRKGLHRSWTHVPVQSVAVARGP